jgi:hypothetical protein
MMSTSCLDSGRVISVEPPHAAATGAAGPAAGAGRGGGGAARSFALPGPGARTAAGAWRGCGARRSRTHTCGASRWS